MSLDSATTIPADDATAERGFTLVELLVTVAIVAILASLGGPSFIKFLDKQATTSQANEFADAVRMARSEALKRGLAVKVCRVADPSASPLACATSTGDWRNGWLVTDGTTNFLVRQAVTNSGGITSNKIAITFQPTGIALGAATSFSFNSNDSTICRSVVIAITGRPRLENC
jgi:type IV fimbrial biogenesis protein FimT